MSSLNETKRKTSSAAVTYIYIFTETISVVKYLYKRCFFPSASERYPKNISVEYKSAAFAFAFAYI